jgi:hypothetical protein
MITVSSFSFIIDATCKPGGGLGWIWISDARISCVCVCVCVCGNQRN